MLGAIIGDIVGSRFEFNPTNDYNFELFTEACGFTDDTICTIAVADALLHGQNSSTPTVPFGEYIHRWCRRYPHPMGSYGGRFAQWVRSNHPEPYNSFGNGSAMRVSPVAWLADSYAKAVLLAQQSAACTHNHPEGIKGAVAVSIVIFQSLAKRRVAPHTQEDIDLCLYMGRLEYPGAENLNIEDYRNRFDETCQGTVPVAMKIIEESHSFEDAIRRAVSLGADADTLGAIVGSMAEAIWGIPEEIKAKAMTYLPQEMRDVITAFQTAVSSSFEQPEVQQTSSESSQPELDSLEAFWSMVWVDPNVALGLATDRAEQSVPATAEDWQIEPMPENGAVRVGAHIVLSKEQMAHLRMGHIPSCQEDHWFMYVDEAQIHIHRSWTGMCVYEAHYMAEDDHFVIDSVTVNRAIL